MKAIDRIKLKIGNIVLKHKTKGDKRNRKVHNLYTAKRVGLIFDATTQENFEMTREFLTSLSQRGIEVEALGFVDTKEIIDFYTARRGFSFFCKKNLNWYGKPKDLVVEDFMKKDYDILIDLSLYENFPIKYIIALTKAKFKAGRYVEKDSPYDFMIDISKRQELPFLIDHLKYYLSVINNN